MAKPLSVLFTASEIFPFAKTGGLADVAYGLPIALRDLEHDVRVMLPKYGAISERKNRIHEINRLKDFPVSVGDKIESATVKSSSILNPRTKVQAYMTTNFTYFDSKWGLYNDPETGIEYTDNDERFIFFCRTVIETCIHLGWFPDVVHCNDWQTALLPIYMKTLYRNEFKNTKTVFTIHNVTKQGSFSLKKTFKKTGLPESCLADLTHKGECNFMKAGILYADHITTVSKSYGQELLNDTKMTNGLNNILKSRLNVFSPIINGIDTVVWSPDKDRIIKRRYDHATIDKKSANKVALLEEFGLEYNPETPVIGMISRLVELKGFGLLRDAINELLTENVQLIVLGEGDLEIEEFLINLAIEHPDKVGVRIGFDDPLAHTIEAGADMFLMPSLHEPCGLNQLYSLAYGTVPIVRATGGLIDTVINYDEKAQSGNGFTFKDYTASAMMEAIRRALALFKENGNWLELVRRGMKEDHSWANSAKKYEEIYRKIFLSA